MNEEIIVDRAIDRYQRLNELLISGALKDEQVAFLQGRMFELMLLINTLDEQALVRLTEGLVDTDAERVNISGLRQIDLN